MMVLGFCLTPCQFTGCSFGAAAILQYETMKSRVQSAKDEDEAENVSQVMMTNCWLSPPLLSNSVSNRLLAFIYYQGSQDMAYWHDWWKQLSGFQRQLILLMSMMDDFWSSLTEGQRTVTGNLCRGHRLMLLMCFLRFKAASLHIYYNPTFVVQVSLQLML